MANTTYYFAINSLYNNDDFPFKTRFIGNYNCIRKKGARRTQLYEKDVKIQIN